MFAGRVLNESSRHAERKRQVLCTKPNSALLQRAAGSDMKRYGELRGVSKTGFLEWELLSRKALQACCRQLRKL